MGQALPGTEPAARCLLIDDHAGAEPLAGYEARGGYRALHRVIAADDTAAVVAALEASGLRGRGGANFPAHRKWELVRSAAPGPRYVVCNGGEHEPGSHKDRELMSRFPHAVLEGLLIAAHTVGARRAWVYITEDQHDALSAMRRAIAEVAGSGVLGSGGARLECELECVAGPPTYVSGEETAALNAIEGREAKPRQKPPYPTVAGLFGAPTLVNNVETLAQVPVIIDRGAAAFRLRGTPQSPGTVLITLSSGVNRPGVYEIPYGTTIRRIIEGCGGGTIGGRAVKALLPGGPSLPFLPGDALDTPFDHESLSAAGSGAGCGAIRVFLQGECMVEPIVEIAEFFAEAQCGQCPPCRMETNGFVMALRQIAAGKGSRNQIQQMEKVAAFARAKGGRCSLIPMAGAPVFSGLQLFAADFERHMSGGACG